MTFFKPLFRYDDAQIVLAKARKISLRPLAHSLRVSSNENGELIVLSAAEEEDDESPRIPPPQATPLDFPACKPRGNFMEDSYSDDDIIKLFSNILRTGPSHSHLESLNVHLEDDLSLVQLLPNEYLPPQKWLQDPAKLRAGQPSPATTPPNEILSNGQPLPGHEAFYSRAKELVYDNEDAFRAIQRKKAQPGRLPARVVHFRKFWDNLRLVADYWDTSLDKYSKSPKGPAAMDVDELRSGAQNTTLSQSAPENEAEAEETYTGRRKDTGRKMPGKYREETIFTFLEPIMLSFRTRLEHARMQPRLKLQGMILPLPHNGNIYRTPQDSRQARRGILEGPLAGVFCRDQVTFRRPEDQKGHGKQEILDLLREVGLMLMLAQKRAREGKQEEPPGNGQWWAVKPRWGGGPGGEVGISEEDALEEVPTAEGSKKKPKKIDRAGMWKEMKPPATTWEKGITYMKIGKVATSASDDVTSTNICQTNYPCANASQIYLFSSVNHHISILHLRVHDKYVEHLPDQCRRDSKIILSEQPWYKLELRRSRWFDILVPEDRIEAMRGLWAVMGWLMRRTDEGADVDAEMT